MPFLSFNKNKKKVGFTLIELSIVLVIIGLIVGGAGFNKSSGSA